MKECSKSIPRRLKDSRFISSYFVGNGIDIGGKPDPLLLYLELFPLMKDVKTWDLEDGDAQFMHGVEDNTYDFVHASHCLEHMNNPHEALTNWVRITKPGGSLIITVPDEDLYEQGTFPSLRNKDHKKTFTIYKNKSWCADSINLFDLIRDLDTDIIVEKIELLNATYRNSLRGFDQTLTPIGESAIEFIITKPPSANLPKFPKSRKKELNTIINQYKKDQKVLKEYSVREEPFTDTSDFS